MITLGGTESARLTAAVRGVAWLVDLDFVGGMQRVTSAPVDVVESGNTYTGVGNAGYVKDLEESADTGDQRVTIGLALGNSAMLALALTNVGNYRNRAASIHLALFDEAFQLVGAKVTRWVGRMDKVNVRRGEDGAGYVEMICSRSGMPRARVLQGRRMTDAQQRMLYAGDTGLRYVAGLIEKPALWLSKEFQKQ